MKLIRKAKICFHNITKTAMRKWKNLTDKKIRNNNPLGLKKLTPVANPESHKTYTDALIFGLKEKDVLNIGLTGGFGSGKSSILESLKKQIESEKLNFKVSTISLASFTENKSEKEVEYRIVQQILYREKDKYLKFSRFDRIAKINPFRVIIFSGLLFISVISGIIMFKKNYFERDHSSILSSEDWVTEFCQARFYIPFIFSISTIFILSAIVYLLYKQLRLRGLKKMSVKEGSLEFETIKDVSTLNLYLDEILFYFRESKTNVLIIEDLDRFSNPINIFTKLREINQLVNKQLKRRKKKRGVTFIYSVKDDLFDIPQKKKENTSETINNQEHKIVNSKTKFFDLIIPVVPYVSYNNSGDIFEKNFKKNASLRPHWNLINEISMYIDDMRVLNNVYNEYIIYRESLQDRFSYNKDNLSQLFSMLLVKNIEPKFFQDLQKNTDNFMESLIFVRSMSIEEINIGLQSQIEREQNAEEPSQKILDSKKAELEAVRHFTIEDLLNSDYFNVFENVLEKNILESKSKVLSAELTNTLILDGEVRNNNLIFYLLKKGYLNEKYQDFISLFHEDGRISKNDNEYVKKVQNNRPYDLHKAIEHPLNVIDWLDERSFSQEYVLNLEIIHSLSLNKKKYPKKYNNIVEFLQRHEALAISFFYQFIIAKGYKYEGLVKDYINNDLDRIETIYSCCEESEKWTEIISRIVGEFGHSSLQSMTKPYVDELLAHPKTFFDQAFVKVTYITKTKKKRYTDFLLDFNIKFDNISELPQHALEVVNDGACFKITKENIEAVVLRKSETLSNNFESFRGFLRFSEVYCSNATFNHLIENVEDLISLGIYNEISEKHMESLEIILSANDHITNETLKKQFFDSQSYKSLHLDADLEEHFESETDKRLFAEAGLFVETWDNLKCCFSHKYDINKHITDDYIDLLSDQEPLEVSSRKNMLLFALEYKSLTPNKLSKMIGLDQFGYLLTYSDISSYELEKDYIKVLVEQKVIEYSLESDIINISVFGKDLSTLFILNNIGEFVESIDTITNFSSFHIGEVLNDNDTTEEDKAIIFGQFLDNHDPNEEISGLTFKYVQEDLEIDSDLVENHVDFFKSAITNQYQKQSEKYKLFIKLLKLGFHDNLHVIDVLLNAYSNETSKLVWQENKKQGQIKKSLIKVEILEILKEIGYITRFSERSSTLSADKYIIGYKPQRK